jgi:DNA polymerase III subunit beta
MKFSCETSLLAKNIQIVKKAISSSPNAPIFSGIHLILKNNKLELIAMDLNFYMSDLVEVNGQEDGDVLVPAKSFSELLTKFDNEVINLEKNSSDTEIIITSEKGKFSIPLMEKEDFPSFPSFTGEKVLTFSEEKIGELINKTIYACSTDETRPLFTGILLEKKENNITFVGTNTHRLAIKTVQLDVNDSNDFSMIIPSRLLREISANIGKEIPEDVEISLKNKQIQVRMGEVKIISSLIEGAFPDYKRVIPSKFATTTVFNAKDMEKAVKRVALFSKDDYSIIRLSVDQDKMVLTSGISDLGQGKENVDCTTKGESLNIAFNSKYVMDILKYAGSEEVVMEMNNSLSPVCIKPVSEENYIYIVTPVRVIF